MAWQYLLSNGIAHLFSNGLERTVAQMGCLMLHRVNHRVQNMLRSCCKDILTITALVNMMHLDR